MGFNMRRMFKVFLLALPLLFATSFMVGCEKGGGEEGEHAVVESGTYEGTIKKVNPDESEIYVDSDGKELELYFIEETKLTKAGEPAEFSALEKGQTVKVEVKKVGKRLDPLSVEIVE